MRSNSVDLYYEEFGEGKPFLFIHGFPLDHTTWLPVARLMKHKARVILPDTRGLGRSPVLGTEATIQELAEDQIRLLDHLQIEKVVVSGHSMGGYIAMEMVHSFPDRVSGLGLIATRADADSPEQAADRLMSRDDVLQNGSASFIATMASRLTDNQEMLPELIELMRKTNPLGIAMAQFAMANRQDASGWLKEITWPIVIVAGSRDSIIAEEVLQNLSKQLRDARYYAGKSATHMVPIEEPGLIARALEETYLR